MTAATLRSDRFKLIVAFACIYLIWGSTYLAIRFAVETMPPLLMAGVRFLIAGGLLYAWLLLRGEAARPTRGQWSAAALLGALFFLGGNGAVSWAETRVPSGLVALLIATIPVWIVLLDWVRRGGTRPSATVLVGVIAGLVGVVLLVGVHGPGGGIDHAGFAVLIVGEIAWAAGTVFSRRLPHPESHLQSGAMQMLAGGAALCVVGLALGEGARFHAGAISTRSVLAVLYLVFAGSIVAFSAYNWLLHASTPARVGTYAFVNPIVAVFLGWTFAGEALGPNTLLAALFIVAGVVLIVISGMRGRSVSKTDPPDTTIRRHPERAVSKL
jgi:drug/metabolite transporter (DMT)-like permease